MLQPMRLTVKGFRGFRETVEFDFHQAVTELYGDNRGGKSSTLNAIEWGLFGGECAGKQTGIRERVGWVIANQHLPAPTVRVELEFVAFENTYVIVRTLGRPPKKTTEQESLTLTLPEGGMLSGAEAQEYLAGLLRCSFRDFMTTAYQHQEAIRAVLTQEPKDRNDAIDRLLGLSDQRNLLCALSEADLRGQQNALRKDFAAFEGQITTMLAAREQDLERLRREATQAGLARNELTGKAALAAASNANQALRTFSAEAGLQAPEREIPDKWTGLGEYIKEVKKTIANLRGQVPGIEEQKKLLKTRQQFLAVKSALDSHKQRWSVLSEKHRDLTKKHGDPKAVDAKIAEATEKLQAEQLQLRQASGQAAVVTEAIAYLDGLDDEQAPCPVCGTAVQGLAGKLKSAWATKFNGVVDRIRVKINALKLQLKDLRGIAGQYQKLNDDGETLKEEYVSLCEKTALLLGIVLGADDDLSALVVAELTRLDSRLNQLGQMVQERQERLGVIEQDLELVRLVRDYLHVEAMKQVLEKIQESGAFKQLEAIRDQVAELVEDAEAIKAAVAKFANEEAASSLARAEKTIDDYFRQLSRNPAVQKLKLAVAPDKRTHRNSYDITDQDGKDLTPVLSQGDLNALALAIFLGLAATANESGTFGFLMLDDPSQSLGTEHKTQLAKLLNQVARHKNVIVSTMDAEFHDCLKENMTRVTQRYRFDRWTPEGGPAITMEETPGTNGMARGNRPAKATLESARR